MHCLSNAKPKHSFETGINSIQINYRKWSFHSWFAKRILTWNSLERNTPMPRVTLTQIKIDRIIFYFLHLFKGVSLASSSLLLIIIHLILFPSFLLLRNIILCLLLGPLLHLFLLSLFHNLLLFHCLFLLLYLQLLRFIFLPLCFLLLHLLLMK
jgi:hypothetical protein